MPRIRIGWECYLVRVYIFVLFILPFGIIRLTERPRQELHSNLSPTSQPDFKFTTIHEPRGANSSFACTVLIPQRPTSPFGSASQGFPSKKAAKTSAAREAVLWLQSSGAAQSLSGRKGGGKGKKKKFVASTFPDELGTLPSLSASGPSLGQSLGNLGSLANLGGGTEVEEEEEGTPAQRVVALCEILGLTPPSYKFISSESDPALIESAAAWFKGEPLFLGAVGEVRNVYGRKRAKDECVGKVVAVLENIKMAAEMDYERAEALMDA